MPQSDFLFGPRNESDHTIFRLWAPSREHVDLIIQGQLPVPMEKQKDGFFVVSHPAGEGTRYKFRSDALEFPDPASRQQDGDTRGWSVVRDENPVETGFSRPWHEAVICEVHVGAATPEGTFKSLADRLEHFRDAGYTALEIMPVNEFPGARNWGYDGTLIFAPESAYGTPDDLKALVARGHELGLTMILDLVYNHFGAVDNYMRQYVPEWFDENAHTPWGPGINIANETVRKFYYENAVMWLREFGFDGLRFDAIHEIKGPARDRFLGELAQACLIAKPDAKLIIENVDNSFTWLERNAANEPMKFLAQWNDDMHHVMTFLVTGEGKQTGYDDPSKDPLADLQKALEDGFVHDREESLESDGRTRGGPASQLPPDSFITYVENHDQIGNRADAMRLSARIEPRQIDFLHFVKFIAPQIPLCFMGDEANLRSGFPFFVDFGEEDGRDADVRRYTEMREIFNQQVRDGSLPHPNDPATFAMAKLPWEDIANPEHQEALNRFRQLASWRREKVWPLTATPCVEAFGHRHEHGAVVNWRFVRGTLTLAYNAAAQPQDMPCLIHGAPVATGEFHQYGEVLRLGAWSAMAWSSI